MNENKLSINNDWIYPDDAPELTDAFLNVLTNTAIAYLLNVVARYRLLQKHLSSYALI
jgi:hypothetical protein